MLNKVWGQKSCRTVSTNQVVDLCRPVPCPLEVLTFQRFIIFMFNFYFYIENAF